jgi:hypothetical protein
MVIAYIKQQKFIDFLKANGCTVVSDENWNDFDRIMMEKDGESFPLQMCEVYYYFVAKKICKDLGIELPPFKDKLFNVSEPIEGTEEDE